MSDLTINIDNPPDIIIEYNKEDIIVNLDDSEIVINFNKEDIIINIENSPDIIINFSQEQ
jgi:hypothetical protein